MDICNGFCKKIYLVFIGKKLYNRYICEEKEMDMAKKKEYGNESISMLKDEERVRKRPGVMFGSDGLEGCQHAAFEILSNSIDEAREGHGDRIVLTYYGDHSIEVEDFGRGCPVDFNEKEQRFNWELVYCELYAGGKYDTASGENYEYSLGLNGLGACATQYASEYMDVTVHRDGFEYSLHFEAGKNIGGLKKEPKRYRSTGTKTRFKPDNKVFTDIIIPRSFFEETMRRQAVTNAGVHFVLRWQEENGSFSEQEFCYPNGPVDYMTEFLGDANITEVQNFTADRVGRDREDKPEYKLKIQVVFAFSALKQKLEYYHNSSYLEHGGAPDKAVQSAFVSAINAYLKQQGKYNKNESQIKFVDVQDCLALVSNCFSTLTSYENQTKKAINNKFIQEAMTDYLKSALQIYFVENKAQADRIADQVLINKRSREKADHARTDYKKKVQGTVDMTNRIAKFVDCASKKPEERELYIVEGDSALGSCKQGRDARFQAIMPVRGKILNCLKTDLDKIFKSEIITDLIKVMGCGVEIKGKAGKDMSLFDLNALRYKRIIICTDADVDGYQIRTLILTMIYRLMPTLIREGYVYIAETPLYEITCGKDTYFAFDDKAKAELLQKLDGKKVKIQRSKGLGENEPEMMWQTTMNPETRRLIRVTPADAVETARMFDVLLGDDLAGRKDYIKEHGSLYVDLADLS